MKTDEAGRFLFIFFISQKTDEATFFKSEKRQMRAFETDDGGPEKQLTFFFLSDWNFKKYSVVLVMYL